MPGLRDLLSRFRAAGAPGAPSAVGVPVDRQTGAAAELEPVFAALADAGAECSRLRAVATDAGRRRVDEASARAATLVAQASTAAPAERASAMAEALREGETARADDEDRSEAMAAAIARAADERIPRLVDQVVERVRHDIAALGTDDRSAP